MNVLIVGCGNIGGSLYAEYSNLKPDRQDPAKGFFEKKNIKYDVAFIAVDTPMLPDGSCDLSAIRSAIENTNAEILVIRSTVPPTTTENLKQEYKRRIVFSPEFYGFTHHTDGYDFSFTILGGNKQDCHDVIQILQNVYNSTHRFRITDSTTAELCKYMANSMLAARVSFCVQFWEIAKQFGVDYSELRELLLEDERFSKANTFVYDNQPYWESHCFDKDIPALLSCTDAPLIQSMYEYNENCKKKYKAVI